MKFFFFFCCILYKLYYCCKWLHNLHKRKCLCFNIFTVGGNGKTTECDITRCNCLSIYMRVCGWALPSAGVAVLAKVCARLTGGQLQQFVPLSLPFLLCVHQSRLQREYIADLHLQQHYLKHFHLIFHHRCPILYPSHQWKPHVLRL